MEFCAHIKTLDGRLFFKVCLQVWRDFSVPSCTSSNRRWKGNFSHRFASFQPLFRFWLRYFDSCLLHRLACGRHTADPAVQSEDTVSRVGIRLFSIRFAKENWWETGSNFWVTFLQIEAKPWNRWFLRAHYRVYCPLKTLIPWTGRKPKLISRLGLVILQQRNSTPCSDDPKPKYQPSPNA